MIVPAAELGDSSCFTGCPDKGSRECQIACALVGMNIKEASLLHRRKHGLDMTSEGVRRLELMHLFGGDLALEQPRPLPPKVKLIGALLPLPAKPLPQDLQVRHCSHKMMSCLYGCVLLAFALDAEPARLSRHAPA